MREVSNIVCVGASAGGLEAIRAFVSVLPHDFPCPVVIAQHLSPTHRSMLAPLIGRASQLPVIEVKDNQELCAGVIYIIPENHDARIRQGKLRLDPIGERRGPHPSVTALFSSLADECKKQSIGVVLSGTGSDGADGATMIDDIGGVVFAQDSDSAKYWGMPKSTIDKGVVRAVLPPEMIARSIIEYVENGNLPEAEPFDENTDAFQKIVASTEHRLNFGISNYKKPTVLRRLGARMAATHCSNLEQYGALLERDEGEAHNLINALLIPVTSFFRDGDAFDELRGALRAYVERDLEKGERLRVWTPGCCTGEEAYSIAILIKELSIKIGKSIPVQIFATDLSDKSIEAGRRGFFTQDQVDGLRDDILVKYFQEIAGGYRVNEELRNQIVFARHDIIRSTPFMNIDLVSCRNLLIYFQPEAQSAAIRTIGTALKPGGLLFLGRSETVGEHSEAFVEESHKAKIYRRKNVFLSHTHRRSGSVAYQGWAKRRSSSRLHRNGETNEERLISMIMLEGNPTFLLDQTDAILQIAGNTAGIISVGPGPTPKDIFGFVDPQFAVDLRSTILACRREKTERVSRRLNVETDGAERHWRIIARPTKDMEQTGETIVIFEQDREARASRPNTSSERQLFEDLSYEASDLRAELLQTREHLRTVIDELEVSNEELQAANEELLASNEEFQATNEELEASNEELQATNEELETINDELSAKNREVADLNSELEGMHNSLGFPLFVFDRRGFIKSINPEGMRFTQECGAKVTPASLADLVKVINSKPFERLMETRLVKNSREKSKALIINKRSYQVGSYLALSKSGEIVSRALAFYDITELEERRKKLLELEERQHALLDGIPAPTALIDPTGAIIEVNKAWEDFARANGYIGDNFGIGTNYIEICRSASGDCAQEAHQVAELIEDILNAKKEMGAVDYPCHSPSEERWFRCMVRSVVRRKRSSAVVMHMDITPSVLAERQFKISTQRADEFMASKNLFLASMSHEIRTPLNAIVGFAQVLDAGLETNDPEKNSEYLKFIVNAGQSLTVLLGDILNFSKIESGEFDLKMQQFAPSEIFDDLVPIIRNIAADYGVSLSFTYDTDRMITVDRLRVGQILLNFVSNAAKYNRSGGTIECGCRENGDDTVHIFVKDTGVGISEEMFEKIFEPFKREEHSDFAIAGAGLGLSISKKLAEAMGGEIGFVSKKGVGSEFWAEFPAN